MCLCRIPNIRGRQKAENKPILYRQSNQNTPVHFKQFMKTKIIVSIVLWMTVLFYSIQLQALPIRNFNDSMYFLNATPSFQYNIIPAPHNTWGYDILRDNKIFIHQPNKPGLPGNEGFIAKKDAIKVAQLVIAKIKKGEMPPTVSPEELKALKLARDTD